MEISAFSAKKACEYPLFFLNNLRFLPNLAFNSFPSINTTPINHTLLNTTAYILTKAVQAYRVIWYETGYMLKLWIYVISLSIKQSGKRVKDTISGKTPFSKAFSYTNK